MIESIVEHVVILCLSVIIVFAMTVIYYQQKLWAYKKENDMLSKATSYYLQHLQKCKEENDKLDEAHRCLQHDYVTLYEAVSHYVNMFKMPSRSTYAPFPKLPTFTCPTRISEDEIKNLP